MSLNPPIIDKDAEIERLQARCRWLDEDRDRYREGLITQGLIILNQKKALEVAQEYLVKEECYCEPQTTCYRCRVITTIEKAKT